MRYFFCALYYKVGTRTFYPSHIPGYETLKFAEAYFFLCPPEIFSGNVPECRAIAPTRVGAFAWYTFAMKGAFLFLCGIIVMVGISHFVFERLHLYDEFLWLDIPMHFIGGFLIFGCVESLLRACKVKHDFLLTISIFLICASIWELNEYFVRHVTERSWYGFFDTIKDYCVGVFGFTLGYYILYIKKYL